MKRFHVRVTPDATGYGVYDTVKGAYVTRRGHILTLDSIDAQKTARLANANSTGTQARVKRVSAVRAKQIIEQARALAAFGPWSDQLDKVMAPGEREFVRKAGLRLPGSYSFVSVLERIARGDSPLRRHRNPDDRVYVDQDPISKRWCIRVVDGQRHVAVTDDDFATKVDAERFAQGVRAMARKGVTAEQIGSALYRKPARENPKRRTALTWDLANYAGTYRAHTPNVSFHVERDATGKGGYVVKASWVNDVRGAHIKILGRARTAEGGKSVAEKAWTKMKGRIGKSAKFFSRQEREINERDAAREHGAYTNPRASGPYSVQVLHATGGYTNKFFGVKLPEARKAFRAACDAYSSDPTKEVLLTGYNGAEKVTIDGCGRGWKKNPTSGRRGAPPSYLPGGFHLSGSGFATRAEAQQYAERENHDSNLRVRATYSVKIEKAPDGFAVYFGPKKNPSTSPARSEFNAAFRAHRAWEKRKIPISEYDAATFRKGIPAVHAETAYRSARDWQFAPPKRLTWKRDSRGYLDAHMGGGFTVTVGPAPAWARQPGFVAAFDYDGITTSPRYLDAAGRSDYGTVSGRAIVFPTEAAAKMAANRYLLAAQRSYAGKSAGAHLREIASKPRNNPRRYDEYGQLIRTAAERAEAAREMAAFSAAQDRRKWKMAENARDADNERRGRKL